VTASVSLQVDARALAELEDWLQTDPDQREAQLEALRAREPAVHARLRRLIDADAEAAINTAQWLVGPPAGAGLHRPGDLIGPYRLRRELGRGGMAEVWLAERVDGVLQRQVAIKLPWLSASASMLAERFARERQVLAALAHPHIARLFDAGLLLGGQPYLVLEYIDGEPLTAHCERLGLTVPQRLRLFLQVCSAVAHAHRQLVVHRDLKPSNILVDGQGQVKLLDFGIAKLLDGAVVATAAAGLTLDHGCAMTPQYAAPEQVGGGAISTATDVYALGVVLYELLTGHTPHGRVDQPLAALALAVLNAAVVPPSRAMPAGAALPAALVGDLDTVVLTALHKLPQDRYGTVDRLADDLLRVLDCRPIEARPPTWRHRVRLFAARHRRACWAWGGLLALLAGTAVATVLAQREAQAQEARAVLASEFLFDVMASAEADESRPAAEVTGREMLEAAVQRAHAQLGHQPQLQGTVLGELGRMLGRLGLVAQGVAVLRDAEGLLRLNTSAHDPALNIVRGQLSGLLVRLEDAPAVRAEAWRLASQVMTDCGGVARRCAMARSYAGATLLVLATDQGDNALALRRARDMVADTERAFGAEDAEMSQALSSLAVVARNGGRIEEASAVLDRALHIAELHTLSASERRSLQQTRAVVDVDLGRYELARHGLQALLAGPLPAAERSTPHRLLSMADAGLGLAEAAFVEAQAAAAAASAVSDDLDHALAAQAQAQASLLLARCDEAQAAVRVADLGMAQAGFADTAVERLRLRRLRAEIALKAGQVASALADLHALAAVWGRMENVGPVDQAQLLDALGRAESAAGNAQAARRLHAQAGVLLAQRLPVTHPLRLWNNLFEAEAARTPQSLPTPDDGVQLAAAQLADTLPPTSVWRPALDRLGQGLFSTTDVTRSLP